MRKWNPEPGHETRKDQDSCLKIFFQTRQIDTKRTSQFSIQPKLPNVHLYHPKPSLHMLFQGFLLLTETKPIRPKSIRTSNFCYFQQYGTGSSLHNNLRYQYHFNVQSRHYNLFKGCRKKKCPDKTSMLGLDITPTCIEIC